MLHRRLKVKLIIVLVTILFITGCDRMSQQGSTILDGYAVRCIEGTKYIIVDDNNGAAISVLYNTEGKPVGCQGK